MLNRKEYYSPQIKIFNEVVAASSLLLDASLPQETETDITEEPATEPAMAPGSKEIIPSEWENPWE